MNISTNGVNNIHVAYLEKAILNGTEESKVTTVSEKIFDRYVVNSAEELSVLQSKGLIRGAFIITGDTKHVGIHKIFWVVQKVL
jgi:hypothetical protein